MKIWDHNIHQHVQKFECTTLELFCFIFVEVIKSLWVLLFGGVGGSPCTNISIFLGKACEYLSSFPARYSGFFNLGKAASLGESKINLS